MKQMKRCLFILLALIAVQAKAEEDAFQLWMDEAVSVTADGETVTYVTVSQYDPAHNYLGFNMEFALPPGIKIHQVRSGRGYKNDIELSIRATDTHTISCNMPDARTLKVACISTQNQELYPDDYDGNLYYPLFTVGLVAEGTTLNGVYDVEMSGISFTWRNAENMLVQKVIDRLEKTCEMTVSGGTDFGAVNYTLPTVGCGTMILPFHSEIPAGMEVLYCHGVTNGTLGLSPVTAIEANTPYVVTGTPGVYRFEGTYRALKETYATPYMTGVYKEALVPRLAYVLQNQEEALGLGFYRAESDVINIPPFLCFLIALEVAGSLGRLELDGLTGLDEAGADGEERVDVYDAQGRLVRAHVKRSWALRNLKRGVYVIDDEKVIVK